MGKICDRFEILHKACVRRTIDNIAANSEAVARRPPAQGLHGGECGARRGTARPRPGSVANGHRTAYGQRYIESWVDGQRQLASEQVVHCERGCAEPSIKRLTPLRSSAQHPA